MANQADDERTRVMEMTREIVVFMSRFASAPPHIRLNALTQVAIAELAVHSADVATMRQNMDAFIRGLQDNQPAVEIAWAESSRHMPKGSETPT